MCCQLYQVRTILGLAIRSDVYLNVLSVSFNKYAKLKRLSLNFFQIYTVQIRKLSTFLTCISVLKSVNPCSCFGRAINDFGKLFSARPYKVTLETKIFRFAPKINFNCEFAVVFTPLPLTFLQSTSLAAVLNFGQIQSTYS